MRFVLSPFIMLRWIALAILRDELEQLYEQLNLARKGYDEVLAENRTLRRKLKLRRLRPRRRTR
jgi:hypothetical protein